MKFSGTRKAQERKQGTLRRAHGVEKTNSSKNLSHNKIGNCGLFRSMHHAI